VQHPGLPRDRLDHVVAVDALQRLEQSRRAAGAAGAAHVDVDDGEAHPVRDDRDPLCGPAGIGVAVPGVLDQGRDWLGGLREWMPPGIPSEMSTRVAEDRQLPCLTGVR